MSLYRKYRPEDFADIIGNEHIIEYLEQALSIGNRKKFPHTVLLQGPTGCGKTTIARIIAKKLKCFGMDLTELNTSDMRGIDTVRDIIQQSRYNPIEAKSKCRVWIIDECHELTKNAQNAFLKILEDTPDHVYFILSTTDPQKLLKAILGRAQRLNVGPLDEDEMFKLLRGIVKKEGQRVSRKTYNSIFKHSHGYPRNAIQLLEQALSLREDKRGEAMKIADKEEYDSIELCRLLMKPQANWTQVKRILNGLKEADAENIRRHVLGYAQSVLLNQQNDRAALIIEEFWEPLYNVGFSGLVYCCYSVIKS